MPSGWLCPVKNYSLTYHFCVKSLDFIANSTVTPWTDLESLILSQKVTVTKEGDKETDKTDEFLNKLKQTNGVSLRFALSAAAQGVSINLELVTVQVSFFVLLLLDRHDRHADRDFRP